MNTREYKKATAAEEEMKGCALYTSALEAIKAADLSALDLPEKEKRHLQRVAEGRAQMKAYEMFLFRQKN